MSTTIPTQIIRDVINVSAYASLPTTGNVLKLYKTLDDGGLYNYISGAYVEYAGGAVEGTAVLSTGETGGTKYLREDGDGTCSWQTPSGSGDMVAATYDPTSVSGDAFDMDNMVEGTNLILSASERAAITANTAKVTCNTANVTTAGAVMDSEVDADIKTLSLPASTTISAFGATLIDDADAATARTTLDVDQAGTDNSTDVTLAGEDFLSLTGQQITANPIDLDNLSATGTPSGSTFLRGDNTWAAPAGSGDMVAAIYDPTSVSDDAFDMDNMVEGTTTKILTNTERTEIAANTAKVTCNTANVTSAGAVMDSEVDDDIKTLSLPANTTISAFGATLVDDADAATARTTLDVDQAGTDNSTDVTVTGEDFLSLTGQEITANPIDLDNLSATGTPSGSTFLRGDNTWAAPAGSGDMLAATYDPTSIAGDAFARANHTGTQTASTISDFDTEVGNHTDVTANTAKVSCTTANVNTAGAVMEADYNANTMMLATSDDTPVASTATQIRTFLNVEDGAEANNISDVNATDLTDAGASTLHYHVADRARANHTGTQAASTITALPIELGIACSDETTALTTGTAKVTFRMPYAMTLTEVRANVTTAPTGATLVVDINEGGTTILSTKLSIDATELTSETAATPPVISDSSLADDAQMTIDIDQVGATVAGAGLKVYLIGTRT